MLHMHAICRETCACRMLPLLCWVTNRWLCTHVCGSECLDTHARAGMRVDIAAVQQLLMQVCLLVPQSSRTLHPVFVAVTVLQHNKSQHAFPMLAQYPCMQQTQCALSKCVVCWCAGGARRHERRERRVPASALA